MNFAALLLLLLPSTIAFSNVPRVIRTTRLGLQGDDYDVEPMGGSASTRLASRRLSYDQAAAQVKPKIKEDSDAAADVEEEIVDDAYEFVIDRPEGRGSIEEVVALYTEFAKVYNAKKRERRSEKPVRTSSENGDEADGNH